MRRAAALDLIPLDVEPCVTECSAESGPVQQASKPLCRAPSEHGAAATLSLLNQSRISTAARTSQRIQKMEGKKKPCLNQAWCVREEGACVCCNEAFALSAQGKVAES